MCINISNEVCCGQLPRVVAHVNASVMCEMHHESTTALSLGAMFDTHDTLQDIVCDTRLEFGERLAEV